jgi:hypothetical protein
MPAHAATSIVASRAAASSRTVVSASGLGRPTQEQAGDHGVQLCNEAGSGAAAVDYAAVFLTGLGAQVCVRSR